MRTRKAELLNRYRRQRRDGLWHRRCSHCRPATFTSRGVVQMAGMDIERAPTPTITVQFSERTFSYMNCSCLGVLRSDPKCDIWCNGGQSILQIGFFLQIERAKWRRVSAYDTNAGKTALEIFAELFRDSWHASIKKMSVAGDYGPAADFPTLNRGRKRRPIFLKPSSAPPIPWARHPERPALRRRVFF